MRGVYRHRLGGSAKGFWQLAPGLSFAGTDDRRSFVLPTGFCELELGHETWGTVSLGVELVGYEDLVVDYTDQPYDAAGTEVSYYLGGKISGWKGVLIFVVAAGIAYASI